MKQIKEKDPQPLEQVAPSIPKELCVICSKMLAKKPDDRYQSAGDLAHALDTFLLKENNANAWAKHALRYLMVFCKYNSNAYLPVDDFIVFLNGDPKKAQDVLRSIIDDKYLDVYEVRGRRKVMIRLNEAGKAVARDLREWGPDDEPTVLFSSRSA